MQRDAQHTNRIKFSSWKGIFELSGVIENLGKALIGEGHLYWHIQNQLCWWLSEAKGLD